MGAPALAFLPVFFASFVFLFSSLSFSAALITNNDTEALFRFRTEADAHGNLLSNWTSSDACTSLWHGVRCSAAGRVVSLSLPFLDLRGPIDSLSSLDQLRLLDLHGNRLNGSILSITNCSNLKLLYLSNNDFSGEIPADIASLKRLLRLDLSDNNLRGPIPASISNLTRLLTLRLQNNLFSGQLPDLSFSLPLLKELNVSNNELFGRLPIGLQRKFGLRSFAGNAGLCGSSPLPVCSFTDASPPASASSSPDQTVVPSNPSSMPTTILTDPTRKEEPRKGLRTGAVVGIVVAICVVVLVIVSFVVAHCCKRCPGDNNSSSKAGSDYSRSKKSFTGEKKVYANNGGSGGGGDSDETTATDRSKLVFFDRRKQFELEDLLRASAEMLGKGSLGTVYKAVLEDGCTAAVKRLKDANPCAKKEFEQYMDLIGKLKHLNIVRLRAYYYAKEEKLLVYDYLPNGSLHYLLHGNRGPGRIPLDWTTRISLVLGAARGLARIHEEYNVSKIPHGNVKSSNVLLDKNGVACISDFGLSLLLNPVHATARLGGYRAPEQAETKRLSQKADVYSFGVLLLEVLTGRAPTQYPSPTRPRGEEEDQGLDLPTWVRSVVRDEWTAEVFDPELLRYKNIEEEMVAMLQVAMACVVPQPEKRPTMTEVAKMIEDIGVEQSPLGDDLDESRNSLSPSLATTEDAMAAY
ncbi:leucine-rich repeat receptor-like protein kinase PXC1 [Telopea speciosissima]|uniref:leucine-rich repeat receptor-like protein kinase PXC1 n=1 Tax=Telopea speciosissima TaxID=54955 RepID=UPI001CC44D69|nr:leucine-rich repeat receptor-like protein kinase PXC1 [Telopea speciosissima]